MKKKIFGLIFLSLLLSFSSVYAQEDEMEESMVKPSFSASNTTMINLGKDGNDNYGLKNIWNITSAEFGLDINLMENFGLSVAVGDELFSFLHKFDIYYNDFYTNLGASYSLLEMIDLSFGLGYKLSFNNFDYGNYDSGRSGKNSKIKNIIQTTAGINVSLPLSMKLGLNNEFNFGLRSYYWGADSKEYFSIKDIDNTTTFSFNFPFLKLINEDLRGGLKITDEMQYTSEWARNGINKSDKANFDGSKSFENRFTANFSYAPFSYLSLSIQPKFNTTIDKEYAMAEKKYNTTKTTNEFFMPMIVTVSGGKFSLSFQYRPTFMTIVKEGKETKKTGYDPNFRIMFYMSL